MNGADSTGHVADSPGYVTLSIHLDRLCVGQLSGLTRRRWREVRAVAVQCFRAGNSDKMPIII